MAAAATPAGASSFASHAEVLSKHAAALAQLDYQAARKLSDAESVVSRLKVSIPRERAAFIDAHTVELTSRRTEFVHRWLPKLTAGINAWRAAPSRETTTPLSGLVCEYVADSQFTCGVCEALSFGVAFAEALTAQSPSSIIVYSSPRAWAEYGGWTGERTLSTLTRKAFEALQVPLGVGDACRALEALESQFVAIVTSNIPWGADLEAAKERWEYFKTGESLIAITERLSAPAYRKQQMAAAAAAAESKRQLIIKARGGDAAARYLLGQDEWYAARHLNPEIYGPLVP